MDKLYQFLGLFFSNSTKQDTDQILLHWNTYYQGLSTKNQEIFKIRTLLFLKSTHFSSEANFIVTDEMKTVISSAFTQITFGLGLTALYKFNTIFIAPRSYAYKNKNVLFDGDVNMHTGRINLSWPAVKSGFQTANDGLNLAIHEFGHCLILENSKRSYYSRIFNETKLTAWKKEAIIELETIRTNNQSVFRAYGGENLMELFSVSLEVFFEKPNLFYSSSPKLYKCMCNLLQQDPRNLTNPLLFLK